LRRRDGEENGMRRLALVMVATALALGACGKGATPQTAAAPAQKTPAQIKAMLATLPAPYNAGDVEHGKSVAIQCRSCHSLDKGGPNMTGPDNYAVVGRKAGSHEGYNYSEALKTSGITWDAPTLDRWLESPRKVVPGTKMSFAGIKDPKSRIDLIAFLRTNADN
jgi:cytochrome c